MFQSEDVKYPLWVESADCVAIVYWERLRWYPSELPGRLVRLWWVLVPRLAMELAANLASNSVLKFVDSPVVKSGIWVVYMVRAAWCAVTSDSVTV